MNQKNNSVIFDPNNAIIHDYQYINSKKELLMLSLTKFFSIKENLDKILLIITGKSKISLRILDWFVTNYSKKYNIRYNITHNDKIKNFIVYLDYKSQLKAYSKKSFDPFCRRERILFIDQDNNEIITTVGQFNFFKWAIENDILKYVDENQEVIENDMNSSLKKIQLKKDDNKKKRRKKTSLSVSAIKSINKHNISIMVQFD